MKVVDLFAGCGGLSLGFLQQGIDVAAAYEYWPAAVKCYKANFCHDVHEMDLTQIEAAAASVASYAPDGIIGGPPCQDFSHAGKRIEANRASLTQSFAQIVCKVRPRFFIMENVDRAQKSHAYQLARALFKKSGYGLTEIVLDASLCGVPQKRKRFICFGQQGKEDGFAYSLFRSRLANSPLSVREYFGDSLTFQYYYRHPRNYSRRGIFSVDEPAPTMRGVNRPLPKGYPGHPADAAPVSEEIRALTTIERARIQTFPQNYIWVGSKTDTEQMIGNAVPVQLARFVAETVSLTQDEFQEFSLTARDEDDIS